MMLEIWTNPTHDFSPILHLKAFPSLELDSGLQHFLLFSRGCSIFHAFSSINILTLPTSAFMEPQGKFTAEKLLSHSTLPSSFDGYRPIGMKIYIHLTHIKLRSLQKKSLGTSTILGWFLFAAPVWAPCGH